MSESVPEFAKRIKGKYPEYAQVDDFDLVAKVLAKYPEYRDAVSSPAKIESGKPTIPEQLGEATLRALPVAGAVVGGIAGMGLGPFGPAGGVGIGGAAGKALENATRAYLGQRAPTPREAVAEPLKTGLGMAAMEAGGAAVTKGIGGAYGYLESRVPSIYRQWFGVPEPITKYTLQRGASNVLTPANEMAGSEMNALEAAQRGLKATRKEAGSLVGQAEDALASSGEGQRMFDVSEVASLVREELKRPKFGPVVSGYGGASAEKTFLEKLAKDLESGVVSGEQLLALRRNLDEMSTFGTGEIPKVSTDLQRVIKSVNNQFRATLNNAYPDLGEANAAFSRAAAIYRKFRKTLGGTENVSGAKYSDSDLMADVNAVRRIRLAMSNANVPKDTMLQFDQHVAQGQNLMRNLMDTIAAQEFTRAAPSQLSPSSPIFRTLAALGPTSPQLGGFFLKAGQPIAQGIERGATTAAGFVPPSFEAIYNSIANRKPK